MEDTKQAKQALQKIREMNTAAPEEMANHTV